MPADMNEIGRLPDSEKERLTQTGLAHGLKYGVVVY